ncbi:MAG: protease modulator HflC [Candidatus Aureabacteria bacterium]|nr:protease modulator HflC [Candidatus Auribacterota bacterium]
MKYFNAILILATVTLIPVFSSMYTVKEGKQVIITQFGKPVGNPETKAGLKFKTPFVQDVNVIEARIVEWDGAPTDMPTKDKLYISVDAFARWRIKDALQYFLRLRDERSAQSRLDDILGSEIRTAVAKHELIEIVRTTKNREPLKDESIIGSNKAIGILVPITKGRQMVESEIFKAAYPKLEIFGIELLDVRFKRINYNDSVKTKIYERMISERKQIAERFRSEGNGEAARILGGKEREMNRIQSEAYQRVEEIRGEADAKATGIYADAYNKSKDSVDFYVFIKSMDTYKKVLDPDVTLILTTESEIFKYLKGIVPDSVVQKN